MGKPTDFEIDVLRICAGMAPNDRTIGWGAAMSEALGALKGAGLIELNRHRDGHLQYVPSDAGDRLLGVNGND